MKSRCTDVQCRPNSRGRLPLPRALLAFTHWEDQSRPTKQSSKGRIFDELEALLISAAKGRRYVYQGVNHSYGQFKRLGSYHLPHRTLRGKRYP
jgi:hypothetical protein